MTVAPSSSAFAITAYTSSALRATYASAKPAKPPGPRSGSRASAAKASRDWNATATPAEFEERELVRAGLGPLPAEPLVEGHRGGHVPHPQQDQVESSSHGRPPWYTGRCDSAVPH
ncbi:hypothetical protein GCM10020229_55280 [Kitasatospora albolonga]